MRLDLLIAALAAPLLAALAAPARADDSAALGTNALVEILTREPIALAAALEAEGFDIDASSVGPGSGKLLLVVSPQERAQLAARGLAVRVLERGRPLRDILAERSLQDGVPTGYLDLAAIEAELAGYAAAHPTLCEVVDLSARFGAPATHGGRTIKALRISDNIAQDEDEPAVLLVAAHHCREIVTPVIALDTIDRLLTGYATNPTLQALVDENELWIVPVWNPDGYHHVFTVDNFWRKNRRPFAGGTGVDLNRNYPHLWSTACGGSTSPSSETYRGPAPASEAETLAMLALSEDRHFAKVLDYHSTGRETLWGYACPTSAIDAFWRAEAIALSAASGYGGAERGPSADGEHYQWQFATRGAMAFLTETHSSFQPTFTSAQAEAALVWPGTLHLFTRAMPLVGHVRDACSGAPLAATITYLAPNFTQGERNSSEPRFGRYHAFLPPGVHTLRFEAPGHVAATRQFALAAGATLALDVDLDALGGGLTTFCVAAPGSHGVVPQLAITGSTSVAANQFGVQASGLPSSQPAALVLGANLVAPPPAGSPLCLGRPARRTAPVQADLLGSATFPVDLAGFGVTAGVTYGLQVLYRDPTPAGARANVSTGVTLVFCP